MSWPDPSPPPRLTGAGIFVFRKLPMPLNLRKIREWIEADCDGNQAEAARRVGMRPQHLGRLLAGGNDDVRLSSLERLADAMRVEPGELIRRVAPKNYSVSVCPRTPGSGRKSQVR